MKKSNTKIFNRTDLGRLSAVFGHYFMLSDQVRMKAYQRAILQVVSPGDIVVDIGTGSGILAFFALQAGAKKVYAIESADIIEEAKWLARKNNLDKKIIFIKGRSDQVKLKERADVIISELIGYFGLEENPDGFIIDARKRFLKPKGKIIPSWFNLYLVPVESKKLWQDKVGFWNNDFYGIDLSSLRHDAVSRRYVVDCANIAHFLAKPSLLYHFDSYKTKEVSRVFNGKFIINRNGAIHGLMGYFTAGLSQGIILSNSSESTPTSWKQTFFPLEEMIVAHRQDKVDYRMGMAFFGHNIFWYWQTNIYRKGSEIAKFFQNDFNIEKGKLGFLRQDFKPVLTPYGRITQKALSLCDGKRNIKGIVQILRREYPHAFKSYQEALSAISPIVKGRVKAKF